MAPGACVIASCASPLTPVMRRCVACAAQGFSLRTLQHLVLDEADRILSLDFEEDIDKILKVSGAGGQRGCGRRPHTRRLGALR